MLCGNIAIAMSKGAILIVEDDRKTSALLALYLQRDGFTPLAAFDGVQAQPWARAAKCR